MPITLVLGKYRQEDWNWRSYSRIWCQPGTYQTTPKAEGVLLVIDCVQTSVANTDKMACLWIPDNLPWKKPAHASQALSDPLLSLMSLLNLFFFTLLKIYALNCNAMNTIINKSGILVLRPQIPFLQIILVPEIHQQRVFAFDLEIFSVCQMSSILKKKSSVSYVSEKLLSSYQSDS